MPPLPSRARPLVALLALCALAWLGWLALGGGEPVSEHVEPRAPEAASEATRAEPLVGADASTSARTEPATASAEPHAQAPSEPRSERLVLLGRVVDEHDRPLAEVVLTLRSDHAWCERPDAPSFEQDGRRREGARTRSAPDGSFRFELPAPSTQRITLQVEPDELHLGLRLVFGESARREADSRPLAAGTRELGTLVLGDAGVLAGHVRGEDGTPIAGARVSVFDHSVPARLGTTSGADGGYRLGRVPPGEHAPEADAEGWESAKHASVLVVAREVRDEVDFALARSATISGRVVDEEGAPVRTSLYATPAAGRGQSSSTFSAEDGSFTLALKSPGAHFLGTFDQRHEPWGGRGVAEALFEPGTRDVLVVVSAISGITFVIVDAESGAPVTRFGARIEQAGDDFLGRSDAPPVQEHATNEIRLSARPGEHELWVEAPGYAPFEGPVEPGGEARQIVPLSRGGSLVARLALGDAPAADVTAELRRFFLDEDADGTIHLQSESDSPRADLGAFAGRERATGSDAEGRIAFEHLAPGTYVLTLRAAEAAPKRVPAIVVAEGETTDLGRLALDAAGKLRGRVLVGHGLSPVGLSVLLDDFDGPRARVASADGRFAFDGLAPGEHRVRVEPLPPVLAERIEQRFTLAAGETLELVLDAATNAPCELTVRVTREGAPVAGLAVEVAAPGGTSGPLKLGSTDAEGLVRGAAPSNRPARVLVRAENRQVLAHSEPLTLPAAGRAQIAVEIRAGELVLVFPPALAIPEQGSFHARLEPVPPVEGWFCYPVNGATPSSVFVRNASAAWTEHRCALGPLAAGSYRLRVSVFRDAPHAGGVSTESLAPPFEAELTIRAGETTVVELRGP